MPSLMLRIESQSGERREEEERPTGCGGKMGKEQRRRRRGDRRGEERERGSDMWGEERLGEGEETRRQKARKAARDKSISIRVPQRICMFCCVKQAKT